MPPALNRVNQALHRWLGLALSLWVLLMSGTGLLLYYKSAWLQWQYPQLQQDTPMSQQQAGRQLDALPAALQAGYAYLPSAEAPYLEVVDKHGVHRYFDADSLLLTRRPLEDTLSWVVGLHHHLMLGKTGKSVQGWLGLATVLLLVTGIIRWWPKHRLSRRQFSIRWYSLRSRKGLQTLSQLHKVSGILSALPLLLIVITGTAVIYFAPVNQALIALWPASHSQPALPHPLPVAQTWEQRVTLATDLMDDAQVRLVYLDSHRLRLKHNSEWHPNGRNYIGFDKHTGQLAERKDVRRTAIGNQLSHTLYPLHASAVGGTPFLLLNTLAGLVLLLLPITGLTYWFKRRRL